MFLNHPSGVDGETLDYCVEVNNVQCISEEFVN
jgi:hypothetical protein